MSAPRVRVMQANLVEFRAPCDTSDGDLARALADWLDAHSGTSLMATWSVWDEEQDEWVLTVAIQAGLGDLDNEVRDSLINGGTVS